MAIVVGGVVLTAWELALLGAAAVTALFLATPTGQDITREAAGDIADALDGLARPTATTETIDDAVPVPIAIPRVCEECAKNGCPPCVPPVGTTMFEIHRVPPSAPHHPCVGDHVHFFLQQQNPNNCQCFLKRNSRPVLCLPSSGAFTPPSGVIPL